jgi:Fic family protein
MPAEYKPEQLWALVQLQRIGSATHLPFEGVSGASVRVVVTDPLRAALHRIDCHQALLDAGLRKGDSDAETYARRAFIEEALASSRIEGADTMRAVGRELLRSGRRPRDRSERMIWNNFSALQSLDHWIHEPLTPQLLCSIQEVLTRETLDDPRDSGVLRQDDEVRVRDRLTAEIVHVPPPASELEKRVRKICDFANAPVQDESFLHPVIKAILLHYQIAYDHPFGDGNGRTARWVFMWYLVRQEAFWWCRFLPVSRMTERARRGYYQAFQNAADDGFDATYLVRQQVRCMELEMASLAELLGRRKLLYERARRRLRLEDEFNVRQLAVFDHSVRHSGAEFSQVGHAAYHGVTLMTAGRDLNGLAKLGFLSLSKQGRTILYRPTPRLMRLAED